MPAPPSLIGIVLAGGRSTRMQTDKALLTYHTQPQYRHAAQLLGTHCTQVLISCQQDQAHAFTIPTLIDQYPDQGPLGGIVTAMRRFPRQALWILACDLPLLDAPTLNAVAAARDKQAAATVVQSPEGYLEPLCSIWEPHHFTAIEQAFAQGTRSIQQLLQQLPYRAIALPKRPLYNANTPQERAAAFRRMQETQHQRNTPKNNS